MSLTGILKVIDTFTEKTADILDKGIAKTNSEINKLESKLDVFKNEVSRASKYSEQLRNFIK